MKKSNLMKFFIITYAWTWLIWTPFILPYFNVYEMTETLEGLIMPAVILGAFGPLVSALILKRKENGKGSTKAFFKECFNFKTKAIYYIVAILLSLGITAFAHYFTNLTNIDALPTTLIPADMNLPFIILVPLYTLMLFLLGGGQEEFGWRGYAQEPMQERFGIIKGSTILGLFWGLWHAPLWLIPGEGHSYYSLIAFLIFVISWSLIIGIIYNLSGKKFIIAWIMHAFGNLSVPLFQVLFLEDVPQPGYWVFAILNFIVASGLALWFYKKNKNLNVLKTE